jgi:RNA polymerase sigma-70 factor (ECF subfamily)
MHRPEKQPDPGETFVVLLAREERMLLGYVMTLVPHPQDADDILQNAKVVMWRNFGQFRPQTNFGAWARKVVFHQVLSHRKRKKRDCLEYSDEFLHAVAEEAEEASEHLERRQRALNDCIANLPEDHQVVLRLRYYEGVSIDAAGERLNRTTAALYRLLSRVRRALFDCVTRNLNRSLHYESEPQSD